MAEPIDLPFGLWTRMCWRMHKFSCICQVTPMCPTLWQIRFNRPCAAAMRSYVKLLWQLVITLGMHKQQHPVTKKQATTTTNRQDFRYELINCSIICNKSFTVVVICPAEGTRASRCCPHIGRRRKPMRCLQFNRTSIRHDLEHAWNSEQTAWAL